MRGYIRHISPGSAVSEMATLWRENPFRWRVLAVSIALTGIIFYAFVPKSQLAEPRKPLVTWITTFDPNRTRAQIIESNRQNQLRQDYIKALEQKRTELRKQLYRELGRATFLDVDAMEAQLAREEAADKKAKVGKQAGTNNQASPGKQQTAGER
ncbi:MAG: hypothetical protein RLZZ08_398 [Pseudomonadota bacterium]|jgi:hypothetical protein